MERLAFVFSVAVALVLADPTSLRTSYIGVIMTASDSTLLENMRPTFEKYLSEEVGLNFSMVLLSRAKSFEALRNNSIDFIFSDTAIFVCLESEFSGEHLER